MVFADNYNFKESADRKVSRMNQNVRVKLESSTEIVRVIHYI